MILYDPSSHLVLERGEFRVEKRFKCEHVACTSLGNSLLEAGPCKCLRVKSLLGCSENLHDKCP